MVWMEKTLTCAFVGGSDEMTRASGDGYEYTESELSPISLMVLVFM